MGESHALKAAINIPKPRNCWNSYNYLKQREHGVMFNRDSVVANYYKHMTLKTFWQQDKSEGPAEGHGSIFNTEFSPNGKFVVAACERSSFLMFDPLNQKLIINRKNAHDDSINCVRFRDSISFFTCSDDRTIALWDARNLKTKLRSLIGHSSWVKSIEYCRNTGKLVTAAFDDTIRVWDLNEHSKSGFGEGKTVLKVARLTRMKLTPCGTKMIISSIPGHLVVIHNLDLDELARSSGNFGMTFWDASSIYRERGFELPDYPSWSTKNRIEVIEEFPEEEIPWCISSLEVHPHGWCVVIRYFTEWNQERTVVYDIQTLGPHSTERTDNSEERQPNPQRLICCIMEPNVARGYIKELCFSNDGRVIGSPFGNTSRLLTFNKSCDELSTCVKTVPFPLTDYKTLVSHKHHVLACQFSPTHPLLASGCRGGNVSFFYPKL